LDICHSEALREAGKELQGRNEKGKSWEKRQILNSRGRKTKSAIV
jgi:hypothetical protein